MLSIPTISAAISALTLLVPIAHARPNGHLGGQEPPVQLISENRNPPVGPTFQFSFEADNGIVVESEGAQGPEGTSVMKGSYSFVMDDGTVMIVRYTADENGFVAESPILPTPPPLPPHAIQQILAAEANFQ